jgi:hypothetical protein
MLPGQKSKQRLLIECSAWLLVGTALRYAWAIGLHVGKEDPSAPALGDESLARTWWSLYSLEQTLSTITGRPSMTIDAFDSIPLPISATEEQATINREPDCQVCEGVRASYRFTKASPTPRVVLFFLQQNLGRSIQTTYHIPRLQRNWL